MNLRRVTIDDAKMLLDWSNDPITRKNSFSHEPIAWENHIKWFEKKLSDPGCLFLILEDDSCTSCGTIRYDIDLKGDIIISYSIAPDQRGKGYGTSIISLGEAEVLKFFGKKKLIGEVKIENTYSKKCFLNNGYSQIGKNEQKLVYAKTL